LNNKVFNRPVDWRVNRYI